MSVVGRANVAARPRVQTKSRRRRAKAIDLAIGSVVARTAVFGVVCAMSFYASSIGGSVMMEQARKDGARVRTRLSEAKMLANEERRRVDALTDSDAMERWALARGFQRVLLVPPAGNPQEATLVAQIDR